MKSLNEYVESSLNYKSAECKFIDELCTMLNLDVTHIKNIRIMNTEKDTKILQIVQIQLRGTNKFRSDDISKIRGLSITTPNLIEIEAGEIHL